MLKDVSILTAASQDFSEQYEVAFEEPLWQATGGFVDQATKLKQACAGISAYLYSVSRLITRLNASTSLEDLFWADI